MEPQVLQNFHLDCEAVVNCMVNMELYASYVYLSISGYFDCDDVALRHVVQFLKEQSHEEREYAEKFLTYQNKGEYVELGREILMTRNYPGQDPAIAKHFDRSLIVSQWINWSHRNRWTFEKLCDILESDFLEEQVKAIKQLGDHLTNLKRLGVSQNSMGEYLFDQLILGESSE
nr:ferritin heavy chain A-like [Pelodiscus sinensis]|eukprot:XP_014428027.1 ferritin heavy chain A-like [Pelodiscus sinensis]